MHTKSAAAPKPYVVVLHYTHRGVNSSCCGKLSIFVARWSRHVCTTSVAWWSTADLKTASLVFVRCNGFVPHVCLFSRCSDRLGREGDASACLRASFACCCGRPGGGCLAGGSGLVATSGAWTAAAGSSGCIVVPFWPLLFGRRQCTFLVALSARARAWVARKKTLARHRQFSSAKWLVQSPREF